MQDLIYAIPIFIISFLILIFLIVLFLKEDSQNQIKIVRIDQTDTKFFINLPKEKINLYFLLKVENSKIVRLYQLSNNFNLEKSALIKNIGILKHNENNEDISDCYLFGLKTEKECLDGAIKYISLMIQKPLKIYDK